MNKRPRKHVVITGTDREGTELLVQLLTNLGLDTGFTSGTAMLGENGRARLECNITNEAAPHIVKDPCFCDEAEQIIQRSDITIERVFISMRDVYAAESGAVGKPPLLQRLKSKIKQSNVSGGSRNSRRRGVQEDVLFGEVYKLVLALSGAQIPVTLLQFPKLVKEPDYLYQKLKPILGTIAETQFQSVFDQIVKDSLKTAPQSP
jgi:hypothetical protein